MTKKSATANTNDEFFPAVDTGVETNPQLVIDFNNVNEGGYEPLPVGTYDAVISGLEIKTSKAGNPMFSVTFNIQHEDFKNRKLFSHYVLNNEIALGRLKKFLLNVFPDIELSHLDLGALCADGSGLGRSCALKVVQRPYEGRMTNDVKEVLPPNDMGMM